MGRAPTADAVPARLSAQAPAAAIDAVDAAGPADLVLADAAPPAASAAILSTPVGQRHRRRSMWFALGSVLAVIAITCVTLFVYNQSI